MKSPLIKHIGKMVVQPAYRRDYLTLGRLGALPPYTRCTTDLLGPKLQILDPPTFVAMYEEIFKQHIYKFKVETQTPYFIDGGANIGLGTIYIKRLYPKSRGVIFEPDPDVFQALQANVQSFGLNNIELVQKALWSAETTLEFMVEGSVAGRVVNVPTAQKKRCVPTVRLRDYLHERVDFLKLDIEGAESEVIQDCGALLENVQNIFVEYHSFAGQPQSLLPLLETLQKSGFRIHIHTPSVISSSPLYKRYTHHNMDLLLNIFGFRDQI
jgi:FkbM family methyltransferase